MKTAKAVLSILILGLLMVILCPAQVGPLPDPIGIDCSWVCQSLSGWSWVTCYAQCTAVVLTYGNHLRSHVTQEVTKNQPMDCPNDPSISAMNYCLQQSYWPGTPGWDSCLAGYYGMPMSGG